MDVTTGAAAAPALVVVVVMVVAAVVVVVIIIVVVIVAVLKVVVVVAIFVVVVVMGARIAGAALKIAEGLFLSSTRAFSPVDLLNFVTRYMITAIKQHKRTSRDLFGTVCNISR